MISSERGREDSPQPPAEAGAAPDSKVPESEQDLRQEIEHTRERLGDTVQLLVAKTDMKSRARAKAAGLTGRVKDRSALARQKAAARRDRLQARATGAWQTAPEGVRRSVTKSAGTARQRWMPLSAALLALGSGYFAFLWWNMRRPA